MIPNIFITPFCEYNNKIVEKIEWLEIRAVYRNNLGLEYIEILCNNVFWL